MTKDTAESRAARLVHRLAVSLDQKYQGLNSMTPCVFDTAWVAMVRRPSIRHEDGEMMHRWLFPECIRFVLERQSDAGGFGSQGAEVDGILNTMAALLMLCKLRQESPESLGPLGSALPSPSDLDRRIEKARRYLSQALESWHVESAIHVGFEILVPGMLRMLSAEGLDFTFGGTDALARLNKRKMALIPSQIFYSATRTTLLHSMEAFVGLVDFGKLRHHLVHGALMGSPSSTAAYLMNLGDGWDDEAEAYLRAVVDAGQGAVPSAFPISIFEITWVMTTLLAAGFSPEALGSDSVSPLADYLEAVLCQGNGITGFAPHILPDADDTAKAILTLNLLGRRTACDSLIQRFETPTHFKTYDLESNGSFSANCNVLNALLRSEDPGRYLPQISKALTFLCQAWYDGESGDKWNLDPQYSIMCLSEVLERTVRLWDKGVLLGPDFEVVTTRVPVVTLQMLIRTLSAQSGDGSWRGSAEITAYALLTLTRLAALPWAQLALGGKMRDSIEGGVGFLRDASWDEPEMIWVEKVTYGSRILCEAYCLAALKACSLSLTSTPSLDKAQQGWGDEVTRLCRDIPTDKVGKFAKFFGMLPVLADEPQWRLRASVVEGCMLAPYLRRHPKLSVFPRPEKSSYLEYVPLTWTTINNASEFGISSQTMCDMMVISVMNFQADKFLEDVTGDVDLEGRFDGLRGVVNVLFPACVGSQAHVDSQARVESVSAPKAIESIAVKKNGKRGRDQLASSLLEATSDTLARFVAFVQHETRVSQSCPPLRRRVRDELHIFLHAHITQGALNARFQRRSSTGKKGSRGYEAPSGTYFDWVRTTSANHTSCPYSFEFFRCLVSKPGKDCFQGPVAGYIAQDLCRHLATMCRQYNDYGSVVRDRKEGNINSVDFAEFHEGTMTTKENGVGDDEDDSGVEVKQTLLRIADYERQCLDLAMERLKGEVSEATWKALRVFVNVTDLYGQIYVVRDINAGQ